jgi:sterol desaturase/sphingolipid hydroxylase (fatty acid hydroxylase superfamily)
MTLVDKLLEFPKPVENVLFSPESAMSIYSLVFALALAFLILAIRQKRRRGKIRLRVLTHALLSRRVFFHRSSFADIGYFVFGLLTLGVLIGWAVVSGATISKFVIDGLTAVFGAHDPIEAPVWALRLGRTLLLFLAYELAFFIDHSLKHRIPALWELHKAHHSAEVLTPLTNFRVHPIDSLILANNIAIVTGLVGGLAEYVVGKPVEIFAFHGTDILMVAYIYLTAQLQHSHIWLPFRGVIGRIFMSPAHHQIHHSSDPRHFNRNMGASLAIWDWLFGTLAIPEKKSPGIKFGVAEEGRDPHNVIVLVLDPVLNALSALLRIKIPLAPTSPAPERRDVEAGAARRSNVSP